eukprot:2435578-Pyramimonas_sp.AAC.1
MVSDQIPNVGSDPHGTGSDPADPYRLGSDPADPYRLGSDPTRWDQIPRLGSDPHGRDQILRSGSDPIDPPSADQPDQILRPSGHAARATRPRRPQSCAQVKDIVKEHAGGSGKLTGHVSYTQQEEERARQVVALGFAAHVEASNITADIEGKLKTLLGADTRAKVTAPQDPTKFALITFDSVPEKITFYKKLRDVDSKAMFGK